VTRETWLDTRFALTLRREDASMKVRGGIGEADLHAAVYGPVLDTLAAGPVTMRQMLASTPVAALGWNRILEALIILMGSGQLQPCLPAKGDAKRAKHTKAFNQAVMRRARDGAELQQLASPVTGGGIGVPRFNQLFLMALEQGRKSTQEWADFVWHVLQQQGQMIIKEGKPLSTPQENIAELREQALAFQEKQLPVLRQLQIA
jgi:hypothetical protein